MNNFTAESLWGHEGRLSDYNGEFPIHMVFYDIQDDKVKQMDVTEEAWNNTLKTFEGNDNVSRNVIYKYMSKHESVKPEPYFNED